MNVKKRLFASALLIGLAGAGVLISGSHNVAKAGPGASPVSIASPLPLPVTGTATVSGTVGATQSGAWNVGITGQPVNVNVANSPAVSLAGNPTVNANVMFPASQGVTVTAAGPLTNVGRLPSKQVMLGFQPGGCPSGLAQITSDGTNLCFDMANHSGEVLVITDFSWTASTNAGTTCTLGITAPPNGGSFYFISAAVAASDGVAAKSEHLTTGITTTVNPVVQTPIDSGLTGCHLLFSGISLTGYLLPNQ